MYQKLIFILLLSFAVSSFRFDPMPSCLILNRKLLEKNKNAIENGDAQKKKALATLLKKADKILVDGKLYSVTHKKQVPPSGDKHDYMSTGPYWWPDPAKPDGLPYIRKDGQVNPTYYEITDTVEADDLVDNVQDLGLAFYFTGDEKYATRASMLVKTWFLDAETKMNPNLNFGQGVPGHNTGRPYGIIETRGFVEVLDMVLLIQNSKSWTKNDTQNLQKWFADYTKWLKESKLGMEEATAKNNHGTHYDAQVVGYALFCGNVDLAKKQLEKTKSRIENQFKADGSQPEELARTASWNYSNMNLDGFFDLAQMAEKVGVDLWNFKSKNGVGIQNALDWFMPYVKKEKTWEFQQIKKVENHVAVRNLKIAALKYKNAAYDDLAKSFDLKSYQGSELSLKY
jgi:hypothetical protein